MTLFSSQVKDINGSGVIAGGHPPVIHNWPLPEGLVVKAGQVLMKPLGGDLVVWDGTSAGGGDASGLTATSTASSTATSTATNTVTQDDTTKDVSAVDSVIDTDVETTVDTVISGSAGGGGGAVFAIAVNDPLDGDTGVIVLIHGCYVYSRITVADAPLTVAQCDQLMAAGLFAENAWARLQP